MAEITVKSKMNECQMIPHPTDMVWISINELEYKKEKGTLTDSDIRAILDELKRFYFELHKNKIL